MRVTAISTHTKTAKVWNLVGEEGGFFVDLPKVQVKRLPVVADKRVAAWRSLHPSTAVTVPRG
jgi:hypothetical protein